MRVRSAALRVCVQLVGKCVDFDLAFFNDNVFLLEGDVLGDLISASTVCTSLGLRLLYFNTLLEFAFENIKMCAMEMEKI